MSGISASTEAVYRTCCHIDLSARKATLGKYNYTEMMEKRKTFTPPEGVTSWEPGEYGRVYIDPNHPWQASLEPAEPTDCSDIPLPDPGKIALPGVNTRVEERQRAQKKEERKEQDEQARLLREECLQIEQMEAMLRKFGMPGYRMDFQSWTLTPDPDYFSNLLARQSELAKSGESQLTQQEIEELSEKCDITQMSSQEYKDLVNYLADKGVIDHPEPLGFDPGEPVRIKGGQAWLESARTTRNTDTPGIAQFLHPSLTERYNRLLAEQAAAKVLQSTGRMDFTRS